RDLAAKLRQYWNVDFDDAAAIGKRYRRQDETGTPYCITVDFDSLEDDAVTIRERDTMQQERVPIDGVHTWLATRLVGCTLRRSRHMNFRAARIAATKIAAASIVVIVILAILTACGEDKDAASSSPEPPISIPDSVSLSEPDTKLDRDENA